MSEIDKMRTTIDIVTGKRFRWNQTDLVNWEGREVTVPARYTSRTATYLHPTRVKPDLLRELNPELDIIQPDDASPRSD